MKAAMASSGPRGTTASVAGGGRSRQLTRWGAHRSRNSVASARWSASFTAAGSVALTSNLPQTAAVSENSNAVVVQYQGKPYVRLNGGAWVPYPQ